MSKELTPLEALERYGYHCIHYVNGEKDYKIIGTALKEKEQLEELYLKQCHETEKLRLEHYKKDKALEIIKEKDVNVYWFRYVRKRHKEVETRPLFSNAFEAYNYGVKKERRLTQEEYDLLKEVLL